jgi:tRNA threonylcarbamoyladenosine biosynthesis protein TsaB
VITLAIDTSEARGSVAVLRDGSVAALRAHGDASDYSAWLLPAVEAVTGEVGTKTSLVDLLGVSTGPGSFTGLRVGLTAVKAWAEVYGTRIVGVSRLEAMVQSQPANSPVVAASYDAQRGQLFAALYRNTSGCPERVGEEMVISPVDLLSVVGAEAKGQKVTWLCLDPEAIRNTEGLEARIRAGDVILACSSQLAPNIGILAEKQAAMGRFSDPLTLDANYVRRSDAEIFWKGWSAGVR